MRWLPGVLAATLLTSFTAGTVNARHGDTPAPPAAGAQGKDDADNIGADDPENEERFKRELWESIKKTPTRWH
jgi:hypothetical protein